MSQTETSARIVTHAALDRHNRRIGILRWAVPALGIAIAALPLFEAVAGRVAEALPALGVWLQSDTLVVAGPRFEGRTAQGVAYVMIAERAETRAGDLDTVDLYGLSVDMADGPAYTAHAASDYAIWTMDGETLFSDRTVEVSDSTGANGVLEGVLIDWPARRITSEGPVDFTFANGTALNAGTMVHDIDAGLWHFTGVHLEMIPGADAGADRDPFETEPAHAPD